MNTGILNNESKIGKIGVSIDEIIYEESDIFRLSLIQDLNSRYHSPNLMRSVRVRSSLLDERFLLWLRDYHNRGERNISPYDIEGAR